MSNNNIDLYEYINKWINGATIYPNYKIEQRLSEISDIMHTLNTSLVATGAKRNGTNIDYSEFLIIYILISETEKYNNTIEFKNSVLELIKKSDFYFDSINELSDGLIIEHEKERILLKPAFKIIENENIEAALINGDNDSLYYPKLDNKNFDKKTHECGDNFINSVRIVKYIIQSLSSDIKFLNEIAFDIAEALVWNIPNDYFNFKDYDKGIVKIFDYIYDSIASEDYMELSEINDIKVLFSVKNNLNRKNILKALYEVKKYIKENM